jgi:hypothetical protein
MRRLILPNPVSRERSGSCARVVDRRGGGHSPRRECGCQVAIDLLQPDRWRNHGMDRVKRRRRAMLTRAEEIGT